MTKQQKEQQTLEKLQKEAKEEIIADIERRAKKQFTNTQKDDLTNKMYFLDYFLNAENEKHIIFVVAVALSGYILFKKNSRIKDDTDKELDYYKKRAELCKDMEQHFLSFVKRDIIEFKELELHAKSLKEYFESRYDNIKLSRTNAHKDAEGILFTNLIKRGQVHSERISHTDLLCAIKDLRVAVKKYSK